jgi:hypothetical protein
LLSVVLKREIPLTETGHWVSRPIPYLNIKPNHPLGRVRHRSVFKFSWIKERQFALLRRRESKGTQEEHYTDERLPSQWDENPPTLNRESSLPNRNHLTPRNRGCPLRSRRNLFLRRQCTVYAHSQR